MTGTEGAGVGLHSGRTTGLFCKLFTIRPVGDVYIVLLLSGVRTVIPIGQSTGVCPSHEKPLYDFARASSRTGILCGLAVAITIESYPD